MRTYTWMTVFVAFNKNNKHEPCKHITNKSDLYSITIPTGLVLIQRLSRDKSFTVNMLIIKQIIFWWQLL